MARTSTRIAAGWATARPGTRRPRRRRPNGTDAGIADFATLIEYVAEITGIERIRYTTSHPREMTAALIDVYGRVDKLVSHLHLPVQSGSDRVLTAMKRGYTALEYKAIVRRLRERRPDLSLTSDFIVGFPGETDADHAATMKLIDDVGFDGAFSFAYSPRPGTPAAELPDPVPAAVSQARLEAVQAKLDGQYRAYSAAMVGTAAAGAGHRPRGEGRRRTFGAHREQPCRQLRR